MRQVKNISLDPQYRFFISFQLCHYSLSENLSNSFRLYCYLKGQCSGKMKIVSMATISEDLKCHPKSITNNLKKLQELNWIGYNPKSKYYFIRGFEFIVRQ